ncbi:hypothetical protein D1816_23010 [Aquimarina sp. AD10]|uniref:hypothetical protein n=1 Tax=Aquimarina sp. AD10 TaxID=1714849 RepID=UPI000E4BCA3B|nr:hypothetical protein [Aquimarina sp. AD10]AXT63094.1 hypothetical protein D1816_23010 [Aquimarina sp. AD10]RKM98690.1 hypothetical protein D7033_12195 [Aquimarina sp. AD10]
MKNNSVIDKECYDIDNPLVDITNDEINFIIQYVLSPDHKEDVRIDSIPFFIANIISYISSETLLQDIIALQKNAGLLKDEHVIRHILDGKCFSSDHFFTDRVKIIAVSYSILMKYELMCFFSKGIGCWIPELSVQVKGRKVYHNLSLVSDILTRESVMKSIEDFRCLSYNEQENKMNILINQLREQDYRFGTKYNTPHIDYISESKKSLVVEKQVSVTKEENKNEQINPFPLIFADDTNRTYFLFHFCMEELKIKDKTKASILYHYFKLHNYLSPDCRQDDYKEFVEKKYGIRISKIFQKNHKAEDTINITLPNLEISFNDLQNEMK